MARRPKTGTTGHGEVQRRSMPPPTRTVENDVRTPAVHHLAVKVRDLERAEAFVPGGWESWTAPDPAGPVAVWLRRPASAAPGHTGRPKVADAG